jgi:hypothetical protein
MQISLHTVAITTDGSGDYTQATCDIAGAILQYRYVPDGTSPLATGADLDIVGSTTGLVVVNQDNIGTSAFTKAPRQATHDDTGAASLYAAAGEPVESFIYVCGESLTVTIAEGGDTKSGTLYLWTGST